jgi:hypothetical protein
MVQPPALQERGGGGREGKEENTSFKNSESMLK